MVLSLFTTLTSLLVVYFVGLSVYNVYFHPLRRFPGPFWWGVSRLPWLKERMAGTLVRRTHELHAQYGPVVRVCPDELAFEEPIAWRDIYGHRTGSMVGVPEFQKAHRFYEATTVIPPSIVTARGPEHSLLRRALAHGFSEKCMRDQEPLMQQYINLMIQRLKEQCMVKDAATGKPKPIDMVAAYNWCTFDIIGDLAFGESFECVQQWQYHPWVQAIFDSLYYIVIFGTTSYLHMRWLNDVIVTLGNKARAALDKFSEDKLKRRMDLGIERPDLIEGLLKRKDEWNIDMPRLVQNASFLVLAGSETTATLLSGATFLLCMNPNCMNKLKEEVRSAFQSDEEITFISVNKLPYLIACLQETLRRYPPVPVGLPRIIPKGGATVAGHFIPEGTEVSITQWAVNHSERLWTDPFGFHPERFMGDPKFASDQRDSLNPFSIGPRNCLGMNLAHAEMRVLLAKMVFNFDMTIVPGQDHWFDQKIYVLWEKKPLYAVLTPTPRKTI